MSFAKRMNVFFVSALCILLCAAAVSCGRAKDSQNSLKSLDIEGAELVPEFDASVSEYSVSVSAETVHVNISAVPVSDKASVSVRGGENELVYGTNIFTIAVTAENGLERVYKLNVIRERPDDLPKLSSLDCSSAVYPAFSPDVFEYSATVGFDTESFEISALSDDPDIKISVKGGDELAYGENTVIVEVAGDTGVNTYTVTVTRLSPDTPAPDTSAEPVIPGPKPEPKPEPGPKPEPEPKPGPDTDGKKPKPPVPDTGEKPKPPVPDTGSSVTPDTSEHGKDEPSPGILSSDNLLKSLVLDTNTMLFPSFSPTVTSYTATVSHTVSKVGVTAVPSDTKAKVSVSGSDLSSTGGTVTVTVKAENGSEKKYSIKVTRRPEGLNADSNSDLVGICYSIWFNPVVNKPSFYYSRSLISGFKPEYYNTAGADCFYYWGKPALGFYSSSNKKIIKTHMRQLQSAGVDFIIIDNTNAQPAWKGVSVQYTDGTSHNYYDEMIHSPVTAIMDTCMEMRRNNEDTPYIVFWNRSEPDSGNWSVTAEMYNRYYIQKYKDLFVYKEGKPLFLTTSIPSNMPATVKGKITVRKMWGLVTPKTSEWSFLNVPNIVSKDKNGKPEQICVCTAAQKTYMSVTSTATGRNHGKTFYDQWCNAFKYRPQFVTLTWWNEWVAQPQKVNSKFQWTDAYNQEYSRDIEPMKGGHGDLYYRWMCQYIDAYKHHKSCPRLVEAGY